MVEPDSPSPTFNPNPNPDVALGRGPHTGSFPLEPPMEPPAASSAEPEPKSGSGSELGPELGSESEPETGPSLIGPEFLQGITGITGLISSGVDAYARGELNTAHATFDQAAQTTTLLTAQLHQLLIQSLVNRAGTANALGDHAAAVASYRSALRTCDHLDALAQEPMWALRAATLINMANALQEVGDLDGAQSVLDQAHGLLASPFGGGAEQQLGQEANSLLPACLQGLTSLAIRRQEWATAHELARRTLAATAHQVPEMAAHPLGNLAVTSLETGRFELADDYGQQALTAFEAAGDLVGAAETRLNLAGGYLRSHRLAQAEPLLLACQQFFEGAGMVNRSASGLKLLGMLAALRGERERARERYLRALAAFEACGAVVAAAHLRTELAVSAYAAGHFDEGEAELARAAAVFTAHGLGPQLAQLDLTHAMLLESRHSADPDPESEPGEGPGWGPTALARAVELAVPAALALDAVRFTLTGGYQRERWSRHIVAPAVRVAFRLATRAGDTRLVTELIETCCAGPPLSADRFAQAPMTDYLDAYPDTVEYGTAPAPGSDTSPGCGIQPGRDIEPGHRLGVEAVAADLTAELLDTVVAGWQQRRTESGAPASGPGGARERAAHPFQLGAALADIAASAGIPLGAPPLLALTAEGEIALDRHIARAEERYGASIRDGRVIPTW
ncbi:tetratricopeptide repeat protein [Streptomyces zagrosensis]|uniref:Tetratricopeptide (TPR) repeat protein n=1 Tax=Streptomyces zagrosensis TaxID=1042984 RepID=A0A7W9QEV6_9ACTN|nr:tetratricopeptide repeat protein [Streptomyces zagrosensis]MBB5937947.1 tetratricopeptide (TPR) repeat protein [Streptomyces zagrosensis]